MVHWLKLQLAYFFLAQEKALSTPEVISLSDRPCYFSQAQRSWAALIDVAPICQLLIKSSQNDLLMGKRINGLNWGSISDQMLDINLVSKDKKGGRLAECIAGRKSGGGILHCYLTVLESGFFECWHYHDDEPSVNNVGAYFIIQQLFHNWILRFHDSPRLSTWSNCQFEFLTDLLSCLL